MRKSNTFIFILLLFGILNCYRRQDVGIPEYKLYVFAENSDYARLEEPIKDIMQREILTPQPEYHFTVVHVNPEKLGEFLNHQHLMFIASLKSEGEIAEIVKRAVKQPDRLEKVKEGENFLFKKKNQWTNNQLVLTLVASTLGELIQDMKQHKGFIYDQYYQHQQDIVKRYLYGELVNKDLSQELMEEYQWKVRVPHDFFIAKEDKANQFVFLRRRLPERWLFIKWFEDIGPDKISPEWYYDLRDSIGTKYYGGDEINRDFVNATEIDFLGRWCLKVQGLWENEEEVVGGPFLAYVFYDEGTERVYAIDCAVFAPGKEKMPFLDQLKTMAKSFKTKVDLQRKEAKQ